MGWSKDEIAEFREFLKQRGARLTVFKGPTMRGEVEVEAIVTKGSSLKQLMEEFDDFKNAGNR